jgi:hypothetical protein
VNCAKCRAENPEVAYYCFRCGDTLQGRDGRVAGQRTSFAVSPGEDVGQLALISSIMPHANRRSAGNYRWALLITSMLTLAFTMFGLLPAAIVAAAFVVPVTYLIYIYDANIWEEAPAAVVALVFLFTGVLAVIVTLVMFRGLFGGEYVGMLLSTSSGGGIGDVPVLGLLIFAVLVPLISEVAKNLGPILLVRRPLFDDMIDGFTFGVAAGTAYAAFEAVILFGAVFTAPQSQTTTGLGGWVLLILNFMIIRPVIYGSATGLAVAAFSGIGEGYDGLKPRYYSAFGLAVGANIAYWLGQRLLAYAPYGQALGLLWGMVVAAVMLLKVRRVLQASLLEAAFEAAAVGGSARHSAGANAYCPECELALLPQALFCGACGSSVQSSSHQARQGLAGTGVQA